ncbi:MAG: rRNA maturation RNase YbeY [Planctomycetaceae bacterium]|jgi:probable rRNA maturation factor|nr:rRNA maturation RNase YbeY [Planctomycetaceae bacterium]MBT4886623.1 rRNA maturation RNase YbeY [Planctomycetaceae bacterium]MBT6458468.1 rRNA maturation RNase YbeY [Planctomycetaceae bacterium]MBT6919112.1 rRNA maturation RNase YbeY [Planctomycetaceae bacterium]MBT7727747.1 rRNA maturation RNase YbeY [Planctomycetaceae bacterium]
MTPLGAGECSLIKQNVVICNRQRATAVCSKTLKHRFISAINSLKISEADISLAIVNDKEIAELHEAWLGIPGPTDVLSFDLSGPQRSQHTLHKNCDSIRGEIIASAETASREALVYHWSPDHELTYYLLHGLLHLKGYNDHTPSERISMRRKERALMRAIGLPSPPRRRPKTTSAQR